MANKRKKVNCFLVLTLALALMAGPVLVRADAAHTMSCGHTNYQVDHYSATCQHAAYDEYQCLVSGCWQVDRVYTGVALDHNYVEVSGTRVAPTCSTAGTYGVNCSYCGSVYTIRTYADATGVHNITGKGHDDTYHWDVCGTCSTRVNQTKHSGAPPPVQSKLSVPSAGPATTASTPTTTAGTAAL